MARFSRVATVGTPDPSFSGTAEPNTAIAALATAIAAAVALAASSTTVAANIATLVADGAVPTQGHVNTLNTNWGTFLTAKNAADAAVAALSTTASAATVSGDVVLIVNNSNVTTKNKLDTCVKGLLAQLRDGTASFT